MVDRVMCGAILLHDVEDAIPGRFCNPHAAARRPIGEGGATHPVNRRAA